MKSKYLLLFLVFIYQASASFATEKYKFRTMSPDGGFYYDGIKAIEQDIEGFIWVMMDYELYRFDGYHYKKYYPYFASIAPTKRWIFNNIASDASGHLYVNTNNGLYRYKRISDRFEKIYDAVSQVKVDKADNVWIRSKNKWSILDSNTGEVNTPYYDEKIPVYSNPVFCLHNQDLYTFIYREIYRYNYAESRFVLCFTLPNTGSGYIRFAQTHMGKLWVFIDKDGLYKIDLSSFKIEDHYKPLPEYDDSSLRAFHVDKKGNIWLGTINGLYILNPSSRELSLYKHSGTDPFSLPNNSIWEIYEDRQDNVWIGTYSGTLSYVNVNENHAFRTYHTQNSGLNYAPVSAFAEEQDYIWIGTEGGGINRMDKVNGEISGFTLPNNVTSKNVKSLVIDAGRNLWISTFRGGLDLYDSRQNKAINYKHSKKDSCSLLVDDIRKTVLEGDSGMWISYQYHKPEISYFSFRSKSFTHFSLDSIHDYAYLFDILRQGEKTLWAISNEALYQMDTHTRAVEKIIPNDSTYLGLFTFCLDDSGNIWIGTIGNGLIKFDTNTSRFISLKNVLQQDIYSIYSICYDNGSVWMGTDNGLFCYNIADNQLMKFDKRENTQGQVYYPLASMKGRDGLLYFGGTNGFTVINPKNISYNSYKPKAIISDFFIDHQAVHPNYTLNDTLNCIILDYDQVNFGFQFSSDNYHIPEKNRFKYRLKGYSDSWITTNAQQRTVMYSKVPAGTYYFEVYAANNDGIWSDKPAVIKVIRKVAPWVSLPAYFLYVLTVIGITYLMYHHYAEKKKLEMLLYQENIEKDQKEQIHQAQLRFFTNISHDFRTPLSLILAALDKLRREGLKEYYYRILNGNVQRLLNLVNELMDFRTVENGMMKLELQPLDINRFIKEIANDFIDYARQRNIDFQILCDENMPTDVYIDKNIVEKIVMNLLNNAFKYTPNGKMITIFIREDENTVSIGVQDQGIGIAENKKKSLFVRFENLVDKNLFNQASTGIGLSLVKELVEMHKATISVDSRLGEGSCFKVDFLKGKEHYDEEVEFILDDAEAPVRMGQVVEIANASLQSETLVTAAGPEFEKSSSEEEPLAEDTSKELMLLVEDNQELREFLRSIFTPVYRVVEAADGMEGWSKALKYLPDIIISDVMMPEKDGIEMTRELRADMMTSHIPIILLTAKTTIESKLEGLEYGADDYITKPFSATYLQARVENLLIQRKKLQSFYRDSLMHINMAAVPEDLPVSAEGESREENRTEPEQEAQPAVPDMSPNDRKFMDKLVELMEQNMDNGELVVDDLVRELAVSRSVFFKKLKTLTGLAPIEFIKEIRIKRATQLIETGEFNMTQISYMVGINDPRYFSKCFKAQVGMTPTEYKEKVGR